MLYLVGDDEILLTESVCVVSPRVQMTKTKKNQPFEHQSETLIITSWTLGHHNLTLGVSRENHVIGLHKDGNMHLSLYSSLHTEIESNLLKISETSVRSTVNSRSY